MEIKKLKGFRDILPDESAVWQKINDAAAKVFLRYGFEEIRLPLLEDTGLFCRSIGEATDIVEKEMYTFVDGGGSSVTLRPEGTASAVRAYVENGFCRSNVKSRLYYSGPMFRRERPQKGRFRQFHQIGAECFGWAEPWADVDVLCLLWDLFSEFGLSNSVTLELNSLGCSTDRTEYKERLRQFLLPRVEELCENCRRRLDANPLRILDCKSPKCRETVSQAPLLSSSLCSDCSVHFEKVTQQLGIQNIPFSINPKMVRGLDYYNRTTFELTSGDLGAQNAVAAGGRYDGLVESLGGPSIPALGFALGVERLILLLNESYSVKPKPLACFIYRGAEALEAAMLMRRELAAKTGAAVDIDFEDRSFKAQMRAADKGGARFAVILGEDEIACGNATIKNLTEGGQETMSREDALKRLADAAQKAA